MAPWAAGLGLPAAIPYGVGVRKSPRKHVNGLVKESVSLTVVVNLRP